MSIAHNMRATAREIFLDALPEASIEKAFDRHVHYQRGVLRICDDLYDLSTYSRVLCISFGKAAHRMAEVLARQVGTKLEGIVVDPNRHSYQLSGYRYFAGGHPQPNEESVRAAEAILKSLGTLNPQALAIFLISGGGSAAVEKPMEAEISLPDLIATYKALVNSGAPMAGQCRAQTSLGGKGRTHGPCGTGRAAGFHHGLRRAGECARFALFRANHAGFQHRGGLLSHRA